MGIEGIILRANLQTEVLWEVVDIDGRKILDYLLNKNYQCESCVVLVLNRDPHRVFINLRVHKLCK